jgi:hypothetical protein
MCAGDLNLSIRTLTNRLMNIQVDGSETVGSILQRAADIEHCSWRPGEIHKVGRDPAAAVCGARALRPTLFARSPSAP